MKYSISTVETLDELNQVKDVWQRFAQQRDGGSFFQSWNWHSLSVKHFGHNYGPKSLLLHGNAGDILAILPLSVSSFSIIPTLRQKVLSFIGGGEPAGDYLDILGDKGNKEKAIRVFLKWLSDNQISRSPILFNEIDINSDIYRVAKSIEAKDIGIQIVGHRTCPGVHLPASVEDYLQELSPKFRNSVLYAQRRFQKRQGSYIKIDESPDEVIDGLEDLFFLHGKRWQQKKQRTPLSQKSFQLFLHELCDREAVDGRVRVYRLFIDSKVAAAMLMFYWKEESLFYQSGWDPQFHRFSPGSLLLLRTIEDSILEKRTYFDFLRGTEPYKMKWANTKRTTATVLMNSHFNHLWLYYLFKLRFLQSDG